MTRKRIVLTVGPLGDDYSVKRADAYYGRYPSRGEANEAAEAEAKNLRREGHEVVIQQTDKKPGR